ncbi:MAG: hypothetical protein EKK36_05360 [Bradyrhizobiaceae bacterium]|nr:MAG: hypothetical protein EKK36_05360 [Bradyrhizobiaceae bacterium]
MRIEDWYPERKPKFSEPGAFEAVIYGSDRPVSSGRSYCAFAIRKQEAANWAGTGFPSEGDSEEYRAYIAASVGVLESLAPKSSVRILTHHETVYKAFMEWLPKWEANGWKRKNKKQIAAEEIFRRFISVARDRQIEWTFALVREDDPLYGIIERLAEEIAKRIDNDAGLHS